MFRGDRNTNGEPRPPEPPLFAIARREAAFLWRKRRPFVVLCTGLPLIYALFFGALYTDRKISHIPVTIVDQDHSRLSRQMTTAILSSEAFTLGQYASSPDEFPGLAATDQSRVCFVFGRGFERNVQAGRPAKVAVELDATNIAIASVASGAATDVIGTFSVGTDFRRSRMRGDQRKGADIVMPVRDEYRILYNPALNANYCNYMLYGFVCVAIQLLAVLLAAESISREVEHGAIDDVIRLSRHAVTVIAGKASVYVALVLPVALLSLVLPVPMNQVPFRGDPLIVALVTLWFVAIVTVLAMGVSAICKHGLLTTQMLAIIIMPSYLLSGFTWPQTAMPLAVQPLSIAEPISYYLVVIRRVTLMGGDWHTIRAELIALGIWSFVASAFTVAAVARLLRKAGGHRAALSA